MEARWRSHWTAARLHGEGRRQRPGEEADCGGGTAAAAGLGETGAGLQGGGGSGSAAQRRSVWRRERAPRIITGKERERVFFSFCTVGAAERADVLVIDIHKRLTSH